VASHPVWKQSGASMPPVGTMDIDDFVNLYTVAAEKVIAENS
jgi:hypothetical protein